MMGMVVQSAPEKQKGIRARMGDMMRNSKIETHRLIIKM